MSEGILDATRVAANLPVRQSSSEGGEELEYGG